MDKYLLYKQTFKNDNITPDEYYKHVTSGLKSNRFQSLDSDFATTMLNLYVHNKVLLDKNIDIDVLSLDSIILPVSDPDLFKDKYSATLLFKKGLRECKSINKVISEVLSKYDTKSPNDVSLYIKIVNAISHFVCHNKDKYIPSYTDIFYSFNKSLAFIKYIEPNVTILGSNKPCLYIKYKDTNVCISRQSIGEISKFMLEYINDKNKISFHELEIPIIIKKSTDSSFKKGYMYFTRTIDDSVIDESEQVTVTKRKTCFTLICADRDGNIILNKKYLYSQLYTSICALYCLYKLEPIFKKHAINITNKK